VALASSTHWRLLIGVILTLMAAAFLAPMAIPAPRLQENRVLAQAPSLPTGLGKIRSFVKATDAYVADRFPARPHLMALLNRARLLARVSGSSRVLVGRDGWLFYNDDSFLGVTRDDPPMAHEDIRSWLAHAAGRTEALRARKIPYLVVAPPVKEAIYPEKAPRWSPGPSPERSALLLQHLARVTGAADVLYLYAPVAEAKQRGLKVFSRHDTHWTGYGAYAGYAALMHRLHATGVAEPPLPFSAFSDMGSRTEDAARDLAMMLGVADLVDLDYPYVDNPTGWARAKMRYLSAKHHWTGPLVIDTGQAGKPVLLMTRDSFSNQLIPFLLPHFSRLILAHNQDGTWRQDLIDRFKPDVVVLEVVEGGLKNSMGDGPPPSPAAKARIDQALKSVAPHAPTAVSNPPIAKALAAARSVSTCNIEAVTATPAENGRDLVRLDGWFALPTAWNVARRGWARIQGADLDYVAPMRVESARPDVAAFLKAPRAEMSGFSDAFYVPPLARGSYGVTLYRRTLTGWSSCSIGPPLVRP
jgi:hypothetical protein